MKAENSRVKKVVKLEFVQKVINTCYVDLNKIQKDIGDDAYFISKKLLIAIETVLADNAVYASVE